MSSRPDSSPEITDVPEGARPASAPERRVVNLFEELGDIAPDGTAEPIHGVRVRLTLRWLRVVPIIVFLGLAIHYFLPKLGGFTQSLDTLRNMSWWVLSFALLSEALSYLANGSLLKVAVSFTGERLPLRRATAIVMAASTTALIAGGVVGYAAAIYQWTRRTTSSHAAAIAATIPTLFDTGALLVVALISAVDLFLIGQLARAVVVALAIVATVLGMLLVTGFYGLARPDRLRSLLQSAARTRPGRKFMTEAMIADVVDRFEEVAQALKNHGGFAAGGAALLNLFFDIVALEIAFLATGHPVSASVLLAGYGVPLLLGRSSFVPGGVAVVEMGMTAIFVSLGVPSHIAVVAILTYRLISFWLPTLIGIPIAVVLQASPRRLQPSPLGRGEG
jgi:glycosyltransferase 2 family protein